ncbi:hypothetical protein [Nocardioides speluncae]|uniref:hypothetical protein n=1 Tax=Nocardioides speluncae TaxID=2670337 RepID=UPI000D6A0475|nr:hypothetical protein [Nocardioides speluncae]
MNARGAVWIAAAAAALLRYPGAFWPTRADEAGYLLVARSWDPQPDSMYGAYWVDRPPLLIVVSKASDALGGPTFLRVVAAVGVALLVLAAAGCARVVTRDDKVAAWTAVITAATVSSAMIDTVAAKGEILAIPLIVTSIWLALLALDREGGRAVWLAFAAGLSATLALGMKQNMASGLLFGGVLLVAGRIAGRIDNRELAARGAAALAGAAVPVVGLVAWARATGVHLDTVWYALYGFRSDALEVISTQDASAPMERGLFLALILIGTGLVFVSGLFVLRLREVWHLDPVVTTAAVSLLLFDGLSLALGGSFWRPYLFALIPGTIVFALLLLGVEGRTGWLTRRIAVFAAASCLVASLGWVVKTFGGLDNPDQAETGAAIAEVARPGDTIVSFGGRADLVLTSGMESPYPHLWSLPMRTMDPEYDDLISLLSGPDRPTWVVEQAPFDVWKKDAGARLATLVGRLYDQHGVGVDCEKRVFLRRGIDRPPLDNDCSDGD